MKDFKINFSFETKEVFEEQQESPSYPGVTTVYRKEIVEGKLLTKNSSVDLGLIGLAGGKKKGPKSFERKDTTQGQKAKSYQWLTAAQCEKKEIKLRAPVGGEEVSGLVQAPIGYSEEELSKFLEDNGVDPTKFGQANMKTLKEFSTELIKGEASLMRQPDGKLVRIVDIVVLWLSKEEVGDILVETEEKFQDGTKNKLDRLPATKRRPDENHFVAAQRVLKKQLKMDVNGVTISADSMRVVEESKESPSYPGLMTLYRKKIIDAELLKPATE